MTRIYLTCPPVEVLIAHAFERYPDCHRLIVWRHVPANESLGIEADFQQQEHVHASRDGGTTMNFGLDYLWDMLKADQMVFEKAYKGSRLIEYIDEHGSVLTA